MVRRRDLIALTLLLRQLEKVSGCSSGLVLISPSPSSSSVLDFWFFFPTLDGNPGGQVAIGMAYHDCSDYICKSQVHDIYGT